MNLTVLYFARLRDAIGHGAEELTVPAQIATVGALRTWLIERGAPWADAFAQVSGIRAAVDRAMARDDTPLAEGAEVAFFPPVTGG